MSFVLEKCIDNAFSFSHQEALSKGMLVQYTSEIAGRVIFGEYRHVQPFTADLCSHSIA